MRPTPKEGIVFLIDPDSYTEENVHILCAQADKHQVSAILVGGSYVTPQSMSQCLALVRQITSIPVVIFPGPNQTIPPQAEAILFLSLINSADPEMIIGKQVQSVPIIKARHITVYPTAYVLLDFEGKTSAAKVAGPIRYLTLEQMTSYVEAAELMGMRHVFLDAGSGNVTKPIPYDYITEIKNKTQLKIWVGGGICSREQADSFQQVGAHYIVIGNALEKNPYLLDNW